MIPVYTVLGALTGAAMLALTTMQFRRRRLNLRSYLLWATLWVGLITVSISAEALSPFATSIGITLPINFVTSFAVVCLFIIVFRIYQKLNMLEMRFTRLAQSMALQSFHRTQSNQEYRRSEKKPQQCC